MIQYSIGMSGEKNVRPLKIPISSYLARWPSLTPSLVYTRPDGEKYIIYGEVEDGDFIWIPSLTDMQVAGYGEGYIDFTDEDNTSIGKTPVFKTYIADTGDDPGEAPEGMQVWIDTLTALGSTTVVNAATATTKAEEAASSAETASEAAENSAKNADEAKTSAQTATDAAESAVSASETAVNKAEESASSADEAAQSAISAANSAKEAAQKAAQVITDLSGKVDKVEGKGLSTNDYTDAEKAKLAGIESEANKTIVDSALSDSSENPVQNKVVNTAVNELKNDITSQKADISQLETALKSGSKDDAVWHLGFYLDDDGYLCQKGDDD